MKFPLRSAAMSIAVAACLLLNVPAYAHNERVHAGMVDLSYQIMKAVENNYPIQPPANLNPQEFQLWLDYLNAIKAAPAKYRGHNTGLPDPVGPGAPYPCNLPPSWWTVKMGDLKYPVHPYYSRVQGNKIYGSFTGCGTWDGYTAGGIFAAMNDPREGNADYTGTALGFWSANVDAGHDDTHLWFRPSSAGGAGAMKHFVNKGVNIGIAILLAPFVCLAEVFAGNPDSCWAHAQDAADTLNPLDEIEGLFPGIGDISGDSSTGMWHHIQVVGGGDNEYDDHQGLLLSSAGPFASMDMIDLGLLAGMDVAGLSIDYEDSRETGVTASRAACFAGCILHVYAS